MLLLPCAIKSSCFFPRVFSTTAPSHRVLSGLGLLQLSGVGGELSVARLMQAPVEEHIPKMLPGTEGLAKWEQKYLGKDLAPSPTSTARVAVTLQEKSLYIYVSHGII